MPITWEDFTVDAWSDEYGEGTVLSLDCPAPCLTVTGQLDTSTSLGRLREIAEQHITDCHAETE